MNSSPFQTRFRPGRPWPPSGDAARTTLPDGRMIHSWHLEDADGPPVVAVHGLGAASDALVPIATELAAHFAVHLPDLPGFGRSRDDRDDRGPAELADALATWARAVDLPPAAFLANSAGCQVVLHLAVRHPGTVDRLVLQGPTIDAHARTRGAQLLRLGLDGLLEHPTLGRVQARGVRQAGFRRLRRCLDRFLADEPEALMRQVRASLLVVRGTRDPLVPQRWAQRLTGLARDARLTVVPGGPHALVYSRPRELAAVVIPFLHAAQPSATTEQEHHR